MNIKKITYVLALLGIMTSGMVGSAMVFAADTDIIDEIGIEIPISCTMSGTGTNTHYASIPNGIYSGSYTDPSTNTSYANGIGTTTIKAFCNDNQGFSIYAIGYTDNIEGKTTLSNEQLGSTYDIITGTATGPVESNDVSNWSMKLSTITSPIPTYPIAIQNSFDSYHEVPDDYTLVAKRESATDVGQNAVGSTLTTTYAAYISKTQPAGLYQGQVKYTMVHPYDAAKPIKKISIDTATTLQQVNTCSDTLTTGQVYTLLDSRDNEEYTVAKLADGNCWMTKNLRLDFAGLDEPITAENTNNPTQAFITSVRTATSSNVWCTGSNATCQDQIVFNSSNLGDETTDDLGHTYDEYGVYYNWYTATAGNGTSSTSSGDDISGDICPRGWHLPSASEYQTLNASMGGDQGNTQSYNIEQWISSPASFLNRGGFYQYTRREGDTDSGRYWTKTATSTYHIGEVGLFNSSVYLANGSYIAYKYQGLFIRCTQTSTQ